MSNLEEFAFIMTKDIKMQDYKNGWFGTHTTCCRGDQIMDWLREKITADAKKVRIICQKMLELDILISVEKKSYFATNELYRFQCLRIQGA